MDLNLTAPFGLSPRRGTDAGDANGGGAIVNIASVMGLRSIGEIPDAAYVASKAGSSASRASSPRSGAGTASA